MWSTLLIVPKDNRILVRQIEEYFKRGPQIVRRTEEYQPGGQWNLNKRADEYCPEV
jgi:hypothetical protein